VGHMAVDTDDWLRNGWQVFQTSGTTAAPRPFFYTRFDREMWAWTNARALYAMGIRGGRDVGMCCFGYGPHVAMWGLHIRLEHMGVPVVPAGGLDTNARGSAIQRFGTTVLSATPSYALYLGTRYVKRAWTWPSRACRESYAWESHYLRAAANG
jgi:phenylacetate-CoA ligase